MVLCKGTQAITSRNCSVLPQPIRYNGALIEWAKDGLIRVSMKEYADKIKRIDIDSAQRKQMEVPVTSIDLREHQSLAGKLNWVGHTALPHCAYAASHMQQDVGNPFVKRLMQTIGILT